MLKIKQILIGFIIAAIGISLFIPGGAFACTTICLTATDGAVVCGRTMEWGTFDLNSRVAIVPRGHEFVAQTPDGKKGVTWQTRYGVVALDALDTDYLFDGVNEKGLVVTSLFHPGFAEY